MITQERIELTFQTECHILQKSYNWAVTYTYDQPAVMSTDVFKTSFFIQLFSIVFTPLSQYNNSLHDSYTTFKSKFSSLNRIL